MNRLSVSIGPCPLSFLDCRKPLLKNSHITSNGVMNLDSQVLVRSLLLNCYYSNFYGLVFNTNDTPSDLDFWPNDACGGILSNRVRFMS